MHGTTALFLAVLAASATAAPVASKHSASKKTSFHVASKGRKARSPVHEITRAYHKYGFNTANLPALDLVAVESAVAPSTISSETTTFNAAADSATAEVQSSSDSEGSQRGHVTASPEAHDEAYLENVVIGGQSMTLNFDTGSSDLWVFSTETPSSEATGHILFNPSESSSFSVYEGGSWGIQYGDHSSASGTVGFDTVTVGGVTASHQAIELATSVSSQFTEETQSDGLMGLGFSNINQVRPQQQQTFFENVMSSLQQPLFTADLDESATGAYTFGAIDSTRYTGEIYYTPVYSTNGYWEFDTGAFAVDESMSNCQTCNPAIADTGTSLMLVDPEIAAAYYDGVPGSQYSDVNGGYIYPCETELPNLAVSIAGTMATLQGGGLTYDQLNSTTCYGGIQSNGATAGESSMQIYGDVFLKQFYAIFDMGNMRFGIASKA